MRQGCGKKIEASFCGSMYGMCQGGVLGGGAACAGVREGRAACARRGAVGPWGSIACAGLRALEAVTGKRVVRSVCAGVTSHL